MSLVRIAATAGTTLADVIRVATHGGSSTSDWDIAHAIEAVTGRSAADIMWAAPARRPQPATAAPTNPRAEYDPEVVVYPEHTSPEETRQVIAHHPGDHDTDLEDQNDEELAAADHLAATVHSDLAHLLDDADAARRLTASWSTLTEAREQLARVLELHPHRRVREALAARTGNPPLAA